MVSAQSVETKAPVKSARKGADATFSLSVLPVENQPKDGGKAPKEAYISLTGLFKKSYEGAEASYIGKQISTNEDTGEESAILYGIFTMRDTKANEGMVLKSKPFIQPEGKGTPNISTDKWTQLAVMKGLVKEGFQSYHGKNAKGDIFFVNTRRPR